MREERRSERWAGRGWLQKGQRVEGSGRSSVEERGRQREYRAESERNLPSSSRRTSGVASLVENSPSSISESKSESESSVNTPPFFFGFRKACFARRSARSSRSLSAISASRLTGACTDSRSSSSTAAGFSSLATFFDEDVPDVLEEVDGLEEVEGLDDLDNLCD